MRDLVLMRGIPGCGKSTFIKENNLEAYTICPDNIRLLFESPFINPKNGIKSISQRNDKKVWELVYQLVEEKMIRGELIIIDAMNIDVSSWKKLTDKYRYNIWVKNFDSVSLEECIKRNETREEYKRVPNNVIINAYNRIKNTSLPKSIREFTTESFVIKPFNVDNYNNIFVFGDIHGCFNPLNEFFQKNPYSDNNLYVFCGDYLDRGLQNKETLEFLLQFTKNKNVMFIEGNHCWERYFANNEIDKIRSNEFLNNTAKQIESIDKGRIRDWCRRWIQMAYLEFSNKKYFITHAGFGFFPKENEMRFIPAHDMIRGGKYEEDVDVWYEEKDCDVIQIHGHRNLYEYSADKFTKTFNLNSYVEFGEPLRVMNITKDGYKFLYFENEICKGRINQWKQVKTPRNTVVSNDNEKLLEDGRLLHLLKNSSDIIEKTLKNGISSFNFKRDVFYKDSWNNLNKIARGLFIDTINEKIIARSYKKFFNFEEGDKNTIEFLENNLVFPVDVYMKYNGFLGILSYDANIDDLHFFSKSTDESDFAQLFKNIAIKTFENKHNQELIKKYLQDNNVTMVFEVIDPFCDHHIIQYDEAKIVLLDIIDNNIEFNKKPYNELCQIAKQFNLEVKEKLLTINNFQELVYNLKNEFPDIDKKFKLEGFVLEDSNGYMFKYKTSFYLFWKKMRGVKYQIQNGKEIDYNKYNEDEIKIIDFMKNEYTKEELFGTSIIDVRNKYTDCF